MFSLLLLMDAGVSTNSCGKHATSIDRVSAVGVMLEATLAISDIALWQGQAGRSIGQKALAGHRFCRVAGSFRVINCHGMKF